MKANTAYAVLRISVPILKFLNRITDNHFRQAARVVDARTHRPGALACKLISWAFITQVRALIVCGVLSCAREFGITSP